MNDGANEAGPEQFDPYAPPPESHGARPGPLPGVVIAAVVGTVALLLVGTAAVATVVTSNIGARPADRGVSAADPAPAPAPETSAPDPFTRGTCFDEDRSDAADDEAGDLIEKSCSGDHEYQVYFAFVLDEEPWPGEAFVDEESERRCTGALREDDPDFGGFGEDDVQWFQPSEDTWSAGDRGVTCFVADDAAAFLRS